MGYARVCGYETFSVSSYATERARSLFADNTLIRISTNIHHQKKMSTIVCLVWVFIWKVLDSVAYEFYIIQKIRARMYVRRVFSRKRRRHFLAVAKFRDSEWLCCVSFRLSRSQRWILLGLLDVARIFPHEWNESSRRYTVHASTVAVQLNCCYESSGMM